MTTIKDVSRYAGVSVATVSRVLNNINNVQTETKEKVLKAIADLDYKPNAVARSLYKKRSNTIGLIVPDITNPFFPELARAVEDTARKFGYTVILCNSDGDIEKEKEYIDVLVQNNIYGLIATSTSGTKENFEKLKIPVVALDRNRDEEIPCVYADNYQGGRIVAKTLYEKGGSVYGQIRGPANLITAEERAKGFQEFLNLKGIPVINYESDFSMVTATKVANLLFDQNPNIDAIFAGNDQIGVATLKVALQRGIKIPEDCQIVGFDGVKISEIVNPSLSTVQQPIYQMGMEATKLLFNLATDKKIRKSICLPVNYIDRETTR